MANWAMVIGVCNQVSTIFINVTTTADAIRYALNHWTALTRFLDDGQIEIDINTAERALRSVALGRKNFLFSWLR
jgi:hypothetical protein